MINPMIRLDPNDNVVVARKDVPAGTFVEDEGFTVLTDVPAGYKCSARFIKKGEEIRKYNTVIGFAAEDTPAGTTMHNHNIKLDNIDLDYAYGKDYAPVEYVTEHQRRTFMGIKRPNGKVATRNYIGVIVCSNCAATAARQICRKFSDEVIKKYPNVDGVVPFVTELGCGMEQSGEPIDLLRRTIAGYVRHPNMGAAIVLAVGCERDPGHTLSAMFHGEIGQLVYVTAGPVPRALGVDALDGTATSRSTREDLEAGVLEDLRYIHELQSEAGVRTVGTVALHRFGVLHAAERDGKLHAHLGEDISEDLLHGGEDVLLGHEAHLDIHLCELWLTVGAQVLVAETASDLEVALHTADHEELLEELRRLRKRVEATVTHTGRYDEVACALRRGLGEDRGLDLDEVTSRERVAHSVRKRVAQMERLVHLGTTQVEVAPCETRAFVGIDAVLDREGRGLRSVEHSRFGDDDLHLTGDHTGVRRTFGALAHLSGQKDHPLRPDLLTE